MIEVRAALKTSGWLVLLLAAWWLIAAIPVWVLWLWLGQPSQPMVWFWAWTAVGAVLLAGWVHRGE